MPFIFPSVHRLTRILTLKEQEYALAAYVIGASKKRIMFKHLIVNCMGPIIVNTTLMVPNAIFTEAFLAFCRYWNQHSAGKLGEQWQMMRVL